MLLLGTFDVHVDGHPVRAMAPEARHLLALLALTDRAVSRTAIAGTLWPESSDLHASASLRSALSRLNLLGLRAVVTSGTDLTLAPDVAVDLRDARLLARGVIDSGALPATSEGITEAIRLLSADCLPDWYMDWTAIEAEEWRQLRLHALDALAIRLSDAGRFGDAVMAALAAVRAEPLRESACAALIRAHLAEGNQSEALRAYTRYRALLLRELGIEPTAALWAPARIAGAL